MLDASLMCNANLKEREVLILLQNKDLIDPDVDLISQDIFRRYIYRHTDLGLSSEHCSVSGRKALVNSNSYQQIKLQTALDSDLYF